MGKGYNNYMCKKPFHPGSKANIKRAWMAEQKTENDKKKQDELKVQYEKEQELYNNRALLSTESKDKLELNFMYQAPPGAKRERQKEDDEPEFKFEWQRKYNAPREDYAKGNADIKDQPFGIPVRNVRCIKCHKWGHINTDKECPLFSQASTSSMPTTSMDPIELMKQMKDDGYGLKENVLGHHLNPQAANQQLIPSDESDPEMDFLTSLSASEKKKLLRKLKKLSKKQEKASRCKKKKSKKTGKSKSRDKSTGHKKKKKKRSEEPESSDESCSESSSQDSTEVKQKKKKHSNKPSSNKKTRRDSSESFDSELDESNKLKSAKKTSEEKKYIKSVQGRKAQGTLSDSENESKKSTHKNPKHLKSKKSKDAMKNSSESDSEFERNKKINVNYIKEGTLGESTKRTVDMPSERSRERDVKMSTKFAEDKKSRSLDKISKDRKTNTSREFDIETTKKIRNSYNEKSSSESRDENSCHRSNKAKISHTDDTLEEKHGKDSKHYTSKSNDIYKHDRKNDNVKKTKMNDNVGNLKHEVLSRSDQTHEDPCSKLKRDAEQHIKSKQKLKDDHFRYEERTKNKNEENIKTELKKNIESHSSDEQLLKRKKDEDETSKIKRKKTDSDIVEQKKSDAKEPSAPHFEKEKDSCDSQHEDKKLHIEKDIQKNVDPPKKTCKFEEVISEKKGNIENKESVSGEKHDSNSKNLSMKLKCNSPLHPDGFSHLCPQARVEDNYVQIDEEYKGNNHDDFRYANRERRSPSVKQKYNS